MPKKIFRTVGKVAGVVAGVALIGSGIGSVLGGTMVLSALGVTAAAGTIATVAGAVSLGASLLTKPKATAMNDASLDRLNASLNPRAPRAMVFGRTAMATDLRDQEFTGTEKEFLHRFFVTAAHKANSIQEIWFDDQLAWTSTGGVQGEFVGYLQIAVRTEGSSANAINISSRMGNARRFTGCAYVHMRFKLTGNSKKTESPFAQQVPARMTIVGQGIPCYDPRQDSTVPGGSGPHRANNQSTWTWGAHARNPACQLATWMLGWRIQNPQTETWRLSVGKGIPADRIDWASFIEAANLCDEPVSLLSGGTEPRYRSDGIVTEADDPMHVVEAFKTCMNADLDDQDGLLRITVFHNDLATPDADFGDDDIEGAYTWIQTPSLAESFNVVRGGYIEPDDRSLYQQAEYDEARLPSPDGIDRIHNCDFALVQSKSQAERLAKQRLQRQQYGGTFRATFLASGWKVQKNSVVRLTCGSQGWTNKLFRVVETAVQFDGLVPMLLREEHMLIYAWDREEGPAPQIAEPTHYAPGEAPIPQFLGTIEEGATVGAPSGTPVGDRPAEDVISQLDQHQLDIAAADAAIEAAEQDIANLIAIYGDTASAGEAMLAAQAALADAELARDAAVAKALEAQGHATASYEHSQTSEGHAVASEGHADVAATERAAAVIARGQAVQAKEDAEGASSAAATSAGLSADARDASAGHANASLNHSQTAGAYAGDAETSALAAVQSELRAEQKADDAEGFANAAQSAQVIATSEAASALTSSNLSASYALDALMVEGNPRFADGTKRGHASSAANAEAKVELAAGSISASFSGRTNVLILPAGALTNIFSWKKWPAQPGHSWRLRAEFRIGGAPAGAGVRQYYGIQQLDADGNPVGENNGYRYFLLSNATYTTTGWKSAEATFSFDQLEPGTAQFRLISRNNYGANPDSAVGLDYYECIDATGEVAAAFHAGISEDAKVVATAEASAAQQSAILSANVAGGGLLKNSTFGNYPSATGAPPEWTAHNTPTLTRVPGQISPNAVRVVCGAGVSGGIRQDVGSQTVRGARPGQWWVIECEPRLISGTFVGAGMMLQGISSGGSQAQIVYVPFSTTPDSSGATIGNGAVGSTYRFSKLIQITGADTFYLRAYFMGHNSALGSVAAANSIEFQRCNLRPATQSEIDAGVAIPALQATVTTQGQTLVNLNTAYGSLSSDVSTMTVTVSQHATAIEQLGDDVDLALGSWGFNVTVGGRVSGMRHTATGNLADTIFETDRFGVVPPGGTGNGLYIVNDAQGRTTLRIRDGSVNVVELGWVP